MKLKGNPHFQEVREITCAQDWWQKLFSWANMGAMNLKDTLPQGHSIVATEDGSYTLFSEAFQEACHSTSGARAETLLHYVHGCQVKNKIMEHDDFTILEVGFGLGIGFLTTWEELPKNRSWHFLSVEMDEKLLEWFRLQHQEHPLLKNLTWKNQHGVKMLEVQDEYVHLTILQGNARETLPKYVSHNSIRWHAIYQDAFSPKKNPVLWTKEWFELLRSHSHPEVILSTYSASVSIRKSLQETGWGVLKGEKFGTKRTSTRAVLNAPTEVEIAEQLQRSPTKPITDSTVEEFLLK